MKFSATIHVLETSLYDFLLGADDGALLKVDGDTLIDGSGTHPFQLTQRSLALARGRHPLEVIYTDTGGIARLLVDVSLRNVGSAQWTQRPRLEDVSIDSLLPEGVKGYYYKGIDWSGEHKRIGEEIRLGKSIDVIWISPPGAPEKP